MIRYTEDASKLDLYARVRLAPVNAIQREIAVDTLRQADALTDALLWAITAVRRLFSRGGSDSSRLVHGN